jgi:hypothetical protein
MTADRRYPLKMRVLEAMWEADNNHVSPDQAQAAIDLIRAETLEEAARECGLSSVGLHFAAAIRALKEAPCSSS